jgi:8-oxo-dGTP diphosphatase
MDIYKDFPGIKVMVSCILVSFNERYLQVLLLPAEWEGGLWLLPERSIGNHESAEESVLRLAHEYAGPQDMQLEQLRVFSEVNKYAGEQSISIAFVAFLKYQKETPARASASKWFPFSQLPAVATKHREMIAVVREELRHRAARQPVGRELLPERFTIPQLRYLYESIYERALDQRNFAKKILSLGILVKLDEKDMISSKKGAYYFMFNPQTYSLRYPASLYHIAD